MRFFFFFGRFSSRNQRVSVPERIDIGRPEHRVERRVITIAVATLVVAARFAHPPSSITEWRGMAREAITTSKRDRRGRSGWREERITRDREERTSVVVLITYTVENAILRGALRGRGDQRTPANAVSRGDKKIKAPSAIRD